MQTIRIPDAINASRNKSFCIIPTDILRNPLISSKAKTIISILLSNQTGWTSYIDSLKQMMLEKKDSIQGALRELETLGYLKRIKYRDHESKKWKGSFWAYTDSPNKFDITEQIAFLKKQNMEIISLNESAEEITITGFPIAGFPRAGKSASNKINNKNKSKINKSIFAYAHDQKIRTNQFELFWKLYPKKVNKGYALNSWGKLTSKKEAPTWKQVYNAIKEQKSSEQWQNPKFIPHASTWLNNLGWLNDARQMLGEYRTETKKINNTIGTSIDYGKYEQKQVVGY